MKNTSQRVLRFAVSGALAAPVCLSLGCPNEPSPPLPVINPAVPLSPQEIAAQRKAEAERLAIESSRVAGLRSLERAANRLDEVMFSKGLEGRLDARELVAGLRGDLSQLREERFETSTEGNRLFSQRMAQLEERFREAHSQLALEGLVEAADELAQGSTALVGSASPAQALSLPEGR